MNEAAARARQPIDLEEFERRLRGGTAVERRVAPDPMGQTASPAYQPQAPQTLGDYARMMGAPRPDPYASPAPYDPYAEAPAYAAAAPALDLDPYRAERAAAAQLADVDWRAPAPAPVYDDPQAYGHQPQGYGEPQAYGQPQGDPAWDEPAPAAPAQRSRRPLALIGGAVAVCVVGAGITYAMRSGPSTPREAPTIRAASGPVKIQPEQPKTEGQAAQSASILDRNGDERIAGSRVVNREEQPVDVREAARAGARAEPPAPAGGANSFFPEPRRVRTVAVRPDGTIAPDPAPPPAPAPAAASSTPAPAARPQPPGAAPVRPAQASAAPAAPKTTERAGAVTPAASTPSVGAPPRNLVPPTQTTASTSAPAPVAAAGAGGPFAVQLAAPGSEAEARAVIARMRQQYGAALGGLQPTTAKASVNGRDIYRVRVVGMSQDGANALCNRLKASGATCFVARN